MPTQPPSSDFEAQQHDQQVIVPCRRYTFTELAAIYNETRVDYIVPMPMNARRMEEYVRYYDIDLDASPVALNSADEPLGIAMLGMRKQRAWVTRLGVIPYRRGRKIGQLLMENLLKKARQQQATLVQLEVIKGNEPAYRLFTKLGFAETRELLIVRRPPAPLSPVPHLDVAAVTPLTEEQIIAHLVLYPAGASWVEEARSVLQAGSLKGLEVTLTDGTQGWVIFQCTAVQIAHVVFGPAEGLTEDLVHALLYHMHKQFPRHDTKVENIPLHGLMWPAYQRLHYVESFRRIEMVLNL